VREQRRILSRRDFIKWAGVAAVSAAGCSLLDVYRPWVNLDDIGQSFLEEGLEMDYTKELIRLSILAASSHNSQPWKFSVQNTDIHILPDYSRRLPVVDPQDRELWISLGCALENLLIAAKSHGLSYEIDYPEKEERINIRLSGEYTIEPEKSNLYDAIFSRQNTRSNYSVQDGLVNPESEFSTDVFSEPGILLRYIHGEAELNAVSDLVKRGTINQYTSKAFVDELKRWLRFNKKEALDSMDGLYSKCSGNPEAPRFIGEWFINTLDAKKQAETDTQKLRNSVGVLVIASEGETRSDWVRTGQVYERWALKMTAAGFRSSMLNQPVEVEELRNELSNSLNLAGAYPQLLVRYGCAPEMPRSLRRPVERVLI